MQDEPALARAEAFAGIPGGRDLLDWFGFVPHFHDAELLDVELSSKRGGILRLHAFRLTDEVDDRGYFLLDRHVLVTLRLSLTDFEFPGIIGSLSVTMTGQKYQVAWDSSYGVSGNIVAGQLSFNLEGWRPELAIGEASGTPNTR